MHNPRVGRFFSVDPLITKYPHYSSYSFSGNKVIHAVELEGLEEELIFVYNSGREDSKIKRVNWADIPANKGEQHGPLGTGTAVFQINLHRGEYDVQMAYIRSIQDFGRDVDEFLSGETTENKTRRATMWEEYLLENFDQKEVENLIEGFGGAVGPQRGKNTGHTVSTSKGNSETQAKEKQDDTSLPISNTDSITIIVYGEWQQKEKRSPGADGFIGNPQGFRKVKVNPEDAQGDTLKGDYSGKKIIK